VGSLGGDLWGRPCPRSGGSCLVQTAENQEELSQTITKETSGFAFPEGPT